MAGLPQSDSTGLMTSINVTPLVDIMLVLLIVFMVTATYITNAAIEVNLPKAAQSNDTAGTMLTVVLKPHNGVDAAASSPCNVMLLNGAVVDETGLTAQLQAAIVKDKETRVMVSADTNCRHGAFVHLVDVVKEAGIVNFAINIEKVAHGSPAP